MRRRAPSIRATCARCGKRNVEHRLFRDARGKVRPYSSCRGCEVGKQLALREAWIAANGPCAICGSRERLEVDHEEPETKVSHRVWSWSQRRRDIELQKCQVLCSRCHKKKTRAWNNAKPIQHGTDGAYTRRRCRCGACREAHRVAKAAYRNRCRSQGVTPT